MAKKQLYRMEVTLKSGAKVEIEVTDVTYKYSMGKTLEWTTRANWKKKMLHIDMDEVVAVVVRKKRFSW